MNFISFYIKKSIDSLLFICDFKHELSNLDLHSLTALAYDHFYINACAVVDNALGKEKRKALTENDKRIAELFKERNKNRAHKDFNYIPAKFETTEILFDDLKAMLEHVREVCREELPQEITLNYVPHDPVLFLLVYRLNLPAEEQVFRMRYAKYLPEFAADPEKGRTVHFINGINCYEKIQHSQHDCLCRNINSGSSDWFVPTQ